MVIVLRTKAFQILVCYVVLHLICAIRLMILLLPQVGWHTGHIRRTPLQLGERKMLRELIYFIDSSPVTTHADLRIMSVGYYLQEPQYAASQTCVLYPRLVRTHASEWNGILVLEKQGISTTIGGASTGAPRTCHILPLDIHMRGHGEPTVNLFGGPIAMAPRTTIKTCHLSIFGISNTGPSQVVMRSTRLRPSMVPIQLLKGALCPACVLHVELKITKVAGTCMFLANQSQKTAVMCEPSVFSKH